MISGDQEFSVLKALTTALPTVRCLDWAAASQHCGLIEHNIHFLNKKLQLLCHSLPFTTIPSIMVVHVVLHIIKFVNGFPCWGSVNHFSPGEIMTGYCLHKSNKSIARLLKMFPATEQSCSTDASCNFGGQFG